ncbi:MAG: Xaa-Pro peptidase family protein [Planctomycetota bacterium]|nr:Xaa-Pro peptidase family protein [Planctomycetota bacterium]MEE2895501.1 Xaa-Pro peptidase family protein [Planctomycetota bacterium]
MPAKKTETSMPEIPLTEYARRRGKVVSAIGRSIGLVHAGDSGGDLHSKFRPHPHFEYLTGIVDEPGAILLLDGSAPEGRQATLFLRPLDPEVEKWDGLRDEIASSLRTRYGIGQIFRTPRLGRMLDGCMQRTRTCACLHPFGWVDQPVSPDLALFRKLQERYPGVEIEDRAAVLAKMRSVKSKAEQRMLRKAAEISKVAYDAMLRSVEPGQTEWDVMETLEHGYRSNGSRGPGYNTIVGAGLNGTVLHYIANDQPIGDGDLIVIDSGADYGGYTADVTRTIPANGKFSPRHKEIYNLVLKALDASIKATKPGTTFAKIDKASRDLITKAGYGDTFIHGIGHHLGLEVHDITPDGPLKEGAVITIEPGIYLPDEKFGVRIEDDILVTRDGPVNLTRSIPRTVAAIEKAMADRG